MNKRVAVGIGLIAGALGLYLWTTRKAGAACTEGAKKCEGANLYTCVNGKWELQELNSPVCILPTSCTVDTDCPEGYVCENGVCVPQAVKQWDFYGVVTDAQTKAPIPSVAVGMNGISSTGDSEGKYTISGVVDTEHIVITFSAEGYATREYGVGWGAMPYELNASLVLKEIAQATLYGTVTDNKGNPVEGATLSLYWDGETHPEFSRIIGSSYSVEAVSPGSWRVTVEKQGYSTWDNMVTVIGGEPNELNIVLTQVWDWEGIYQPEDYIAKWQDMVARDGNMEGVIADISQIPGIEDNASTAGQNLYWRQRGCNISDFSAPDGHGVVVYYPGWKQILQSWAGPNVYYDDYFLSYIAIYAECKRHGSTAPSYREFWDNLGTKEYGPGCPGRHCQVAGYIRYDSYGSGIGWDVGYRWDLWVHLYRTGELLHYI